MSRGKKTASERYLERATRGLWGRKRKEIREELEAHLHERMLAHRIGGLGEADAEERALAELGDPRAVSAGMMRLYTLPTLVGSGLLTTAAASLSVVLLTASAEPALPGTFYWPSEACVQALAVGPEDPLGRACIQADNSLWLEQEALQAALEPQGVIFSEASVPGSSEGLLGITFPGSTSVYSSLGRSNVLVSGPSGEDIPVSPGYLSFWDLVKAVSYQQDLRIAVEGWDNPKVHFNTATLQIGTETHPMNGIEFYENYLDAVFFKDLSGAVPGEYVHYVNPRFDRARNPAFDESALRTVSIPVPEGAPGVYGIVTRLNVEGPFSRLAPPGLTSWDVSFMFSVARSGADGTVSFDLPTAPLQFVKAFSAEEPEGTSVLVRLGGGAGAGEGWYEVVAPETLMVR